MIRNPISIGIVQAADNGIEHLPIPVGHNGTISHLLFLFYAGDVLASENDVMQCLDSITLDATNQTEGNFRILNEVTPAFLAYREARARVSASPAPQEGILQYDPAIGLYKDELLRNERTLGCADLSSMGLKFDFSGQVSATNVDRIEVWMDVDYNLIQPLGEHVRIDRLVPINESDIRERSGVFTRLRSVPEFRLGGQKIDLRCNVKYGGLHDASAVYIRRSKNHEEQEHIHPAESNPHQTLPRCKTSG